MCLESSLWTSPNWPKIRKMTMTSQFPDMMSSSTFFDAVFFLLSNLVTGPSFRSISSLVLELWQFSFIRDWPETRNLEIGNTPPWGFPIIWRLRRVVFSKFGTNVYNRMLLKAAKFQGYRFYRFWIIKGKNKFIPHPY